MSAQQSRDSCGSHGSDAAGEPLFDYTCDDCMLPYNWKDYDEDPEYIKKYGTRDKQEGIKTRKKFAQGEQKPF